MVGANLGRWRSSWRDHSGSPVCICGWRLNYPGKRIKKMSAHISNVRPKPDKVLVDIVDYVTKYKVSSKEAYETARYCLMDTLGCGFEALEYPACTKMLGPVVPGTVVPNGAKVPGTPHQLDAIQAAFNIGTM